MSLRTLHRLKFLWLALVIALLNAGMPVAAYATMAGQGGLVQVICTPAGMQTIVVDDDGTVRPAQSAPPHGGHCLLCAITAAPPPAPALAVPAPAVAVHGAVRVGQTLFQSGSAVVTPPATGPPAAV